MTAPTLLTGRLELGPLATGDALAVRELGNDRRIAEMTRTLLPYPFEREAAETWVRKRIRRAERNELLPYSIVLRDQGVIRGHLGLATDEESENAGLHYWLGVPYWGYGYASGAAGESIRYAFEELGLRRVYAHHFARNPVSGRMLEKLGMRREGCLGQHYKKWDRFEDLVLYGILAEEWTEA